MLTKPTGNAWEPHSSSVDFCEPNYLVSEYVAEPHNAWSSLLITMLALIGFFWSNPTREWRFSMMYLILGAVGIGSALLHLSLHWLPQSSDEIPMLWQSLSFLYALIVLKEKPSSARSGYYGLLFIIVVLLQTFIYYRFQQVYAIFVASFLIYSSVVTIWLGYLSFCEFDPSGTAIRKKLFTLGFISFGVLGAAAWLIDMHMCDKLMPYYLSYDILNGITLHVLWHWFSALGTYIAIVLLTVLRAQALKQEPIIVWVVGVIPICKVAIPIA